MADAALAIDYSWARPSPAFIRAAGYRYVMRYVSLDPTKNITPGEAGSLHAVGLELGLIWESGAEAALAGGAGGASDATAAVSQALAIGYAGVILFNVGDFQATPDQMDAIATYYDAAVSVCKAHGFGYGGYGTRFVMDQLIASGRIGFFWQNAMNDAGVPGGDVSPHAFLYQRVTPTLPPIPGGGYDEDVEVVPGFPWWAATTPPPPAPAPAPRPPIPAHAPDGNPWTILRVDGIFGGLTTRAAQWKCGVADDGVFGPISKRAFQAHLHVITDGIIGSVTVRALQARVGVNQDGVWGPVTTSGLQSSLNAGRF